ncbi:MAG TPA: hypothetical protein VF857_08620 [Spirochaetota bacterium]
MRISEQEIERKVDKAVQNQQVISFVTYTLSEYGEMMLKVILREILEKYNRTDLFDIAYTSAKELIINATKANLKRVLFKQMNLNMNNESDYETGMDYFRQSLTEDKIRSYRSRFKENSLPVTTTLYYNMNVLNIKVKNNFMLEEIEERRIRERFSHATSFSSLFDFFMEYGENAEGAGMGITMVGILLDQSGIDKHGFTLYSSPKYHETIAKLEIPLVDYYLPKRKKFDMEVEDTGMPPDELRKEFHYTYRDFRNKE